MNRKRVTPSSAVALLLACMTAAAPGQLDLDGPPAPGAYYRDALDALETQIARRLELVDGAPKAQATVLAAQKNYRMVARRLLTVGRDAGYDGAVATITAMRLVDASAEFDKLTAGLPARVAEALAEDPPDQAAIDRMSRAVTALKAFNERVDDGADRLTSAEAPAVDAYAQRMLAPLAIVAEVLEAPPQPAWPIETDGSVVRLGAITTADLAKLTKRIAGAPIAAATEQQLLFTARKLQRAHAEVDLQPAVASLHEQVSRLIVAAERFGRAPWLNDLSRSQVARQTHDAAVLLNDPKMRQAGEARIDRLTRTSQSLAVIGRLNEDGFDTQPLADALMAGHRLSGSADDADSAEMLLATLDRISRTIEAQRKAKPGKLPSDIRRVYQVIRVQYAQQQRRMIASLPKLAADPTRAALPQFTTSVDRLEALGALTRRLNRIPDWIERMKRLNPVASRGLSQQLRLIADDLLDEATHAGAAAALAEIDRQLALFEQLPYEGTLKDARSPLRRGLGERHAAVAGQLKLLRGQWATAWSTRTDPTQPGSRLLLLRRLFEQLHDAGAFAAGKRSPPLNRWSPWQMSPRAITPLVAQLPRQLNIATAQAAQGQWDALRTTLDSIDTQSPVARLAAMLSAQLGSAIKPLRDDAAHPVADVLGQCLFAPSHDAFGRDLRLPLAKLAVMVNGAAHARAAGDADLARRLAGDAATLARQLINTLNHEPEPARLGQPFGAIDV